MIENIMRPIFPSMASVILEEGASVITSPDALFVENAGDTFVEGVYPRDGDLNGVGRWTPVGGVTSTDATTGDSIVRQGSGALNWVMDSQRYGFPSESGTIDVPLGQWEVVYGASPAPTVRYATWAEIDAAGIDRSTVPTL